MQHLFAALITTLYALLPSAYAQSPSWEFLEAKGATAAVILAHGRGEGPDSQVVGPLRRAIAQEAGLHTLSVQLPVLATQDYLAYASTYPTAYQTLQSAVDFLAKDKGVKRIYVMGYSMGARMTTAFLASRKVPDVVGYIGVGMREGGGELLDANINIRKLAVPILDLYADSSPLDLSSAEHRKDWAGVNYKQVRVQGANHSFRGYEDVLSVTTIAWLKEREQQQ
jgi:dienelactone hydrolase